MCGIVGGVIKGDIVPLLLTGLSRLQYRGYDSAGLAFSANGELIRRVTTERVAKLRQLCESHSGTCGIGHTRWATHGAPNEQNAHPIQVNGIQVVHNGIIENHAELRQEIIAGGGQMHTDTDTETVVHLIARHIAAGEDLLTAVTAVSHRLIGAYALAVMAAGHDEIICIRQGSPLLVGSDGDTVIVASDSQALIGFVKHCHPLSNGETARLRHGDLTLWRDQTPVPPRWMPLPQHPAETELGEHTHFMQKEIFQQPAAAAATLNAYIKDERLLDRRFGKGATPLFRKLKQVTLIACGTSHHAGLAAAYNFERLGIPCRVEIASEYRYRDKSPAPSSLIIAISQSGETADTLSAMRLAQQSGNPVLAIVNVDTSAMAQEADILIHTRAGPEIGVASTKSFTTQLIALHLLALAIAKAKGLSAEALTGHLHRLRRLPHLLQKALLTEPAIRQWAEEISRATGTMFIGRQAHYPVALEGALKLKEISYIHAEGCAAGELKHGPLALVDHQMPVIGLVPDGDLVAKMAANLSEVSARGGRLYLITGKQYQSAGEHRLIRVDDDGDAILSPIIHAVCLQLLAYHTARQKGTDIDKPRNLAKSVTVE